MSKIKILGKTKTVDGVDPGQAFGMFSVWVPKKGTNAGKAHIFIDTRMYKKDVASVTAAFISKELKWHTDSLKRAVRVAKQIDAEIKADPDNIYYPYKKK